MNSDLMKIMENEMDFLDDQILQLHNRKKLIFNRLLAMEVEYLAYMSNENISIDVIPSDEEIDKELNLGNIAQRSSEEK